MQNDKIEVSAIIFSLMLIKISKSLQFKILKFRLENRWIKV